MSLIYAAMVGIGLGSLVSAMIMGCSPIVGPDDRDSLRMWEYE